MTSPASKTRFKIGDYLIVAVILLSAVLLWLVLAGGSTPRELLLSVDGEVVTRYTLPLSAEYTLDALPYPCMIVIDGYTVSLRETSCPGHDCERDGAIDQSGESIVCLPNRLLLTLTGGGEPGVDAVTQ